MGSRIFVADPGVDDLIERTMVAPIALMDLRVAKMTPMVASLIASLILEGEKAHATKPMVSVVLREPIIVEIAREKDPVMVDFSVIKTIVDVLLVTIESMSGEVVGLWCLQWQACHQSR